ncbi:nuclear transport factor 2 family protein [Novosphingobium cyanobacteriorum]|uniref:Nuclear transport factor 2 family protein n=1 Tax=Novosphingobium cyanobacteriorum TaxID=3024215 RepID=A0ABT6CJJ3_9SPHN|nr:nuclear transport factor 2 family protein [Novosphingobium cyanobacteriorum]MDF8333961.1 nuclear transport factor 2 family protein [Novosphingobium cyanobacteriorum]
MTDLAIRLRRAAFNRALAEADLAAIGPILSPNCILVTGTDSAVIAGRKAQLVAWKREFAARPRTAYTRTTETVTVSAIEPIAMETGHWQGLIEGQVQASGTYGAKWRQAGADWLLEAEIFVTLD